MKKNWGRYIRIMILVFLAAAGLYLLYAALNLFQQTRGTTVLDESSVQIERHYGFIAKDIQDLQWEELYLSTKNYGLEHGDFVECLNQIFPVDYTYEELMETAIAMHLDGIFLEGDDTEELGGLIQKAEESGTPVITLMRDCAESERICFVGTSNYNLGREYARQIIDCATPGKKNEVLLVYSDTEDTVDIKMMANGLDNTLANEGNHLDIELEIETVDSKYLTVAQHLQRRINAQKAPDIIVCLNDGDTKSAYRVLRDLDQLKKIHLIGASMAERILTGIENGDIHSCVVMNTAALGRTCIEAMDGNIAGMEGEDLYALDADVLNIRNVDRYRLLYKDQ